MPDRMTLTGAAAAILLFATAPAWAAEFVITQGDKRFSERRLTISVGDTITFVNDDTITHNIHSSTDGFDFDLGAQAPGESFSYVFEKPGKLKIRCAIHPKMKLELTVE